MTFQVGTPVRVSNSGSNYQGMTGCIISVDNNLSLSISVEFGNGTISHFQPQELDFLTETEYLLADEVNAKHLKKGIVSFQPASDTSDFGVSVQQVVNEVRDTLIAKNKAYGNSALEPVRVFSTADPVEQLRVRIDDKLSRLKSSAVDNEDTVLDLMGYLVLLRIATRKQDSE